jgi:cobalt-zinc-cadmium efflux system membrane fusion protein
LNENNISRSINVLSPIDGYVTMVKQNVGKYVAPTDVIFELVNPDDIHLAITVFEKDLNSLYVGQEVIASNNSQPEVTYKCEIIFIGKELSKERAVTVHCHFKQYDKSLIPGMYMNADIKVSKNSAYVISNDGLVRFDGKQFVFEQVEERKYKMIEVSTQNTENDHTQIIFKDTAGIESRIFVLAGAYNLLMKMKNTDEGE